MPSSRQSRIGCPGFHQALRADALRHAALTQGRSLSRRGLLKAGVVSIAGLTLSQLLRLENSACASASTPRPQRVEGKRVNSVIILWMRGGPAQHETCAPKPDPTEEYRGEFGDINTSVHGIFI